jgi:hypothetical protein
MSIKKLRMMFYKNNKKANLKIWAKIEAQKIEVKFEAKVELEIYAQKVEIKFNHHKLTLK